MRGTFTILIAIMLIAFVSLEAQDLQWTANAVDIRTFEGQTGLSMRINAERNGKPIGSWTSKSGQLPQIVGHKSMTYDATIDTTGAYHIEDVVITPDGGKTLWIADSKELVGFTVRLPIGETIMKTLCKVPLLKKRERDETKYKDVILGVPIAGLPVGKMSGLSAIVKSRDQKNTMHIFFIPIGWNGTRNTSCGNDLMIQNPPANFDFYNNQEVFACLRGFVSSDSVVDLGVIAQQDMTNNFVPKILRQTPPPLGSGNPAERPLVPQSTPPSTSKDPNSLKSTFTFSGRSSVMEAPETGSVDVTTRTKVTVSTISGSTKSLVNVIVRKNNHRCCWKDQEIDISRFNTVKNANFIRNGVVLAQVETHVYRSDLNIIEMFIVSGDLPQEGDQLFFSDEGVE
ncbi:MAG: hypothetical protein WCP93_03390 [Candidatus Berkelbacteria bacterium]